jgi:hypothetical protein
MASLRYTESDSTTVERGVGLLILGKDGMWKPKIEENDAGKNVYYT